MRPLVLNEHKWDFVNMNSPADLSAIYDADNVKLYEYDRCRNGHLLLSRNMYQTDDIKFSLTIQDMQDGVGIGLYCGMGAFTNYVYAAIFKGEIEIRIPSGVPNGDTFMFEGQKNYYVITSKSLDPLPDCFNVEFTVKNGKLNVSIDDCSVIECDINRYKGLSNSCRVLIKAVNENNMDPKTSVTFSEFYYEKLQQGFTMSGRVLHDSINVVNNCNVHLAGYSDFWTTTDEHGRFSLENLPVGSYTIIAGKEGYAFSTTHVDHHENFECMIPIVREDQHMYRTEYPRADMRKTNAWRSLNGYWSFDFDKNDAGEEEMWFAQDQHVFSRSINVPFPWSSLLAFGEQHLVDSDTLHQSNTFCNNSDITGGLGWYYKEISIPDDFSSNKECILNFNAVSGVSKIWFDGVFVGNILDSYNQYSFQLGKLIPGSKHFIAVKVNYPYSKLQVCSGKQGFWFTESPGIWQSVWLENVADLVVQDIEVEYELNFLDQNCKDAKINGQVNLDVIVHTNLPHVVVNQKIISEHKSVMIEVVAPESNLYKLELNYTAAKGRVIGQVYVNDVPDCEVFFDCTIDSNWSDQTCLWMQLRKGNNRIAIIQKEDMLTPGQTDCILNDILVYEMPPIHEVSIAITSPDGTVLMEEQRNAMCVHGKLVVPFQTTISSPELWDAGNPILYKVGVEVKDGENHIAERKFGLRLIETDRAYNGNCEVKQIYLNKKPIFLQGIMDQGYNPWGVYTYPYVDREKGSMGYDIQKAEEYGYNLIRMHIKDNEPHWYSICDEVGMLVWDEHPSNFYAKAEDLVWRGMYLRELRAMMRKHGNHPSVVMFSTFNESWGIEGWHERSPWDNLESQQFIKDAAKEYKSKNNVLVIDNSGYAKTSETDIIDHHSYPIGYKDASGFWRDLLEQDYPGSTFNFFNEANVELMNDNRIRELLQRNCSQDLAKMQYAGDEVQAGQPILISEFVHTDGNEKNLRIFPKVSGYTRMNLASQENEDTSFMNQLRECRDFGFVNEDMESLDTHLINSMDAIIIDYPRLSRMIAGDMVQFDVYCSLWNNIEDPIRLQLIIVGINQRGDYEKVLLEERSIQVEYYHPIKLEKCEVKFLPHYKAAYVFAILKSNNMTIAQDYVQFEIQHMDAHAPLALYESEIEISIREDARVDSDQFSGLECENDREMAWIYGTGILNLENELDEQQLHTLSSASQAFIKFEVSSCENIKGVKITDERKFASNISVMINDIILGDVELEDCPYDDRALFSRAAAMNDTIFNYNQHSGWGYGYRQIIQLKQEHMNAILAEKKIRFTIITRDNGVIVYGNNMGRYGKNPFIMTEET